MKDLIKKILREETSGLTDGKIKVGYDLMNMITKDYQWYSTPYATWLINPDTKQWMLEWEKSGKLWYHLKVRDTFSKYLNMDEFDFESFIEIWVEDVLKRGVVSTSVLHLQHRIEVEDVLKNGKQMK